MRKGQEYRKRNRSWCLSSHIRYGLAFLLFSLNLTAGLPAFSSDLAGPLPEAVALCIDEEISSTEALQQDLRDIGWGDAEGIQASLMAEGIAIRNRLVNLRAEPPTSDAIDRANRILQNGALDGTPALESPDGLVLRAWEEDIEGGRHRQCEIVGGPNSVVPDVHTFYDNLVEIFDPGFESYSAPHYRFRDEGRVILAILLRPDPVAFDAANPDRPGAEWMLLLASIVPCEACQ